MINLAWTCIALLVALVAPPAPACNDVPNIIVFVSDDHRADVLGCAGHPIVRTPAIDSLAANGVRFSNAFVTTSICAASRATILTGLVERTHRYTFGTPPLSASMCDRTYPARLRGVGYRTGFVGKLGVAVEGDAHLRMFDSFEPLSRSPYRKLLADGTTRHLTDITGDRAIEFLRSNPKGAPFCLSISFNAAHAEDGDLDDHYPFPDTERDLYHDVVMPRPRIDGAAARESRPQFLEDSLNRRRYAWRWDTPEKYDRNLRNYFRMLTGMDRNIGRVIAELDELDLSDNTVILFLGDNGYYMGERGFAGKWTHYEQSLRIPLVVYDPRSPRAAGAVVDAPVLNLDIAPTVLALAGVDADAQGRSLTPFLENPSPGGWRTGFFCEHLMRYDHIPRWQGYRTDRYKYAIYFDQPGRAEFLHDLQADPDELTNLAPSPEHHDVLEAMRVETERLAGQYARGGDPLPRVLLLGDSISMGYHRFVEAELIGEAIVVRPPENCAGTTRGVARIHEWLQLDGGDFDVIHFNFGLHDLKHVHPDGSNSNDPSDPRQADPVAYKRNLQQIVAALKSADATLIFATTTPFPPGVRPHRSPDDVADYNAVAIDVMREHAIDVNDLCQRVSGRLADLQRPVNVHFNEAGSRALGAAVASSLRDAISALPAAD